MTPEAAEFLAKARLFLDKANGMLERWPDEAGRASYLAGLHAAQSFIVERTGIVIRSHKGVQRELARLTKDMPDVDRETRAFLGRTYNLKAIADYESSPGTEVSPETAAAAIVAAERFVARIADLIEMP